MEQTYIKLASSFILNIKAKGKTTKNICISILILYTDHFCLPLLGFLYEKILQFLEKRTVAHEEEKQGK